MLYVNLLFLGFLTTFNMIVQDLDLFFIALFLSSTLIISGIALRSISKTPKFICREEVDRVTLFRFAFRCKAKIDML